MLLFGPTYSVHGPCFGKNGRASTLPKPYPVVMSVSDGERLPISLPFSSCPVINLLILDTDKQLLISDSYLLRWINSLIIIRVDIHFLSSPHRWDVVYIYTSANALRYNLSSKQGSFASVASTTIDSIAYI